MNIMNKVVGVTKPVYELCKVLEEFEEEINFTVFYSFAEILENHFFCPAFTFDGVYYEVQYDETDCLKVVDFGVNGRKEIGDEMTDAYIESLTINIKKHYGK